MAPHPLNNEPIKSSNDVPTQSHQMRENEEAKTQKESINEKGGSFFLALLKVS